jgi:hypothetical protein
VRAIADPVHEGEHPLVERPSGQVVLHDDDGRDAGALGEEGDGVLRVVQDVDEERGRRRGVRQGKAPAVELPDRDRAGGAQEDVEPLWHDAGLERRDRGRESPAAAADVDEPSPGEKRREGSGEDPDPPAEDEGAVRGRDRPEPRPRAHRRFSPRIERKNDERSPCAPRTRRSAPGIIRRIETE